MLKDTTEDTPVAPDPKDARIAELEGQVKALETFANAVVTQRNNALNQLAMKE